jgi:hypothetical protein
LLEPLQQLRDGSRSLGELRSGSLRGIARRMQSESEGRKIGRTFQLGLAAYGHERSRPNQFGHGMTLRPDLDPLTVSYFDLK